ALDKNAHETERWQAFKADNETAISNLDTFSKHLSVEVMVPIGKKALMPGELIHTNELLVGHYQGYFSACSAHKAKEICQHRLRLAEEHLKQLEVEADLWQNKLDKPLLEGAVPSAGEIEIVEDYDEEAHKQWLQEHRESVRKQKQEERIQREEHVQHEDVFKQLEEREMMEELGLDPDDFNQQELDDLVGTAPAETKDCDKEALTDEQVFELLDKLEAEEQREADEIDPEAEQNLQNTNELVQNLMKGQTEVSETRRRIAKAAKPMEDADSSDEEESDQPEEVKLIREQMRQLPEQEREEFLKSQIQIIKAKMRKIQKEHFISDELTHLMNVVVSLEDDLQEMIFEHVQADSTEPEQSDETESLPDAADNKKRRISFATTDEQLIFRHNEPVADMLPKVKPKQEEVTPKRQRDIIALDTPLPQAQSEVATKPASPKILQKVEQNLEFVKENQSVQDFDLVNQILEASTGQINTLHISFQHSEAVAHSAEMEDGVPANPAHFYELYKKDLAKKQSEQVFPIYVNSFEGEEELRVPILKEEAREAAYTDPRAEFSKCLGNEQQTVADTETKSILRNKSAVELEARAVESKKETPNKKGRNKKKKPRTLDDELRDMSAYQKVMHDLVEKEPTVPEPLPEGKYVDAHAPKKRVSRFKEQRSMSKT
ncbi:hypothetical protein KR222_005611, partial [Zaprionus bogoriensis]